MLAVTEYDRIVRLVELLLKELLEEEERLRVLELSALHVVTVWATDRARALSIRGQREMGGSNEQSPPAVLVRPDHDVDYACGRLRRGECRRAETMVDGFR
mmetsp:Transcript_29040/g.58506  ORF Transcript_29040/g.58506 Transcript_29040/m.58506 type:complete len:101 (+) Transcript_29040:1728-2030(+)